MSKILSQRTRTIFLIFCLMFSMSVIGLIFTIKSNSQSKRLTDINNKANLIARIENSPEFQLRVLENSDTPLRITEAKAKEISAADFTSLTGETTDLLNISSVPEVTVRNVSGKTITQFMLVIRDPKTRTLRSQDFPKLAILSGETFSVKPKHFISPEKITYVDGNGLTITQEKPRMDHLNYWISFAERSDFFITVGVVYFDDGSRWMLREEGEIK